MPLYELKCHDCEHVWETRIAYKAPLPECPECGGADVRKVYHPAALIFKGSGWHVTDYGRNGAKRSSNGSTNGKDSESRSSADTSGSSDTSKSETSAKSEA